MRAQKDSEGRRLITGCAHKGSLVIHLDKDHTSGAAREVFAVLRIYFFTLHSNVCQFHLTFLYDAPLYFYHTDSDELTVYPCRSLTHPTHWLVVTKSPSFRLFRRRPGFDKGFQSLSRNPLSCNTTREIILKSDIVGRELQAKYVLLPVQ